MIEPRLYRVAFLPTLLVLALLMFSFESRPPPLPQGLAADVLFDGRLAAAGARSVASRHPDRRPGSPGDLASARAVADELSARGFVTRTDRFDGADGRPLANVVGTRPGASPRRVVLLAARDSVRGPDPAGSAADTAALLEFARVLGGRATGKTIVLASVDGSTLGEAGARRFAQQEGDGELVDAVLVVSDLGAARARGPLVVEWSNDSSRASIGWQRTVAASLREELGRLPGAEGVPGQVVRLALPLGVGAQGPLLDEGLPALRLSGSGELPPAPDDARERPGRGDAVAAGGAAAGAVDSSRLGDLGRASLRALSAVDSGAIPEPGPPTYLIVAGQILPGWVLSVLALALLLPAVFVSIDAFARARRRRDPVARWVPWLALCTLPYVIGLCVAYGLALVGAIPAASEAAPRPGQVAPGIGAVLVLAAVAASGVAAAGVGWWRRLRRAGPPEEDVDTPAAPGAACACTMLAAGLGLAVWWASPFAGLLLAPTVHLWILAAVRRRPARRGEDARPTPVRARAVLALLGLLPPLVVVVYYTDRLALGPLEAVWYATLVVAGGHAGFDVALLGCLFLGLMTAVGSVVLAIARRPPPAAETTEPSTHAAPALGRSFYRPLGGAGR